MKATRHQEIWKRTKNGVKLVLPKKINTDIGFQLMFGYREDFREEVKQYKENCENYECKIYEDVNDYKKHI